MKTSTNVTLMAVLETDTLAKLIRAKRDCLVKLRDMGRCQMEMINEGDMTALLGVLAAKQRSLGQLQRIERALDPFRDQDPKQRDWRTAEDRHRCSDDLEQCETLLGEIVSQEKCAEGEMVRRRDETASRLQGAHFAARARGAYTQPPANNLSQLDLTSDS